MIKELCCEYEFAQLLPCHSDLVSRLIYSNQRFKRLDKAEKFLERPTRRSPGSGVIRSRRLKSNLALTDSILVISHQIERQCNYDFCSTNFLKLFLNSVWIFKGNVKPRVTIAILKLVKIDFSSKYVGVNKQNYMKGV